MIRRSDGGAPSHPGTAPDISRRTFLKFSVVALGGAAAYKVIEGLVAPEPEPLPMLEQWKAEFDRMSSPELAQWILDSSGDEATSDQPVRTPERTEAYEDLRDTAEGNPAYIYTLLKLDGKEIKMDVEINRDILLFRALLTMALRDPANYFDGKPILIQSGQLTNRSGKHTSRHNKSHFYGSSIDFSGAMIDGSKSDEDPDNLYPYDSPINGQLGMIADAVGKAVGVETSRSLKSLERVDSLHGTPLRSTDHYHYNASDDSARDHAVLVRSSLKDQPELFFEIDDPAVDLRSAGMSSKGRNFIHAYETFSSETYGDAGGGRGTLTIGYGATYYLKGTVITRDGQEVVIENDGQKPRMGDTITEDEADQLSEKMRKQEYLRPVVVALEKNGMAATQHQLDALVSYSFHRGGSNAAKLVDRLKGLIDAGHGNDGLAIRAAFMYDINTVVAERFRKGVARRYLDTADIFMYGDYKRQDRSFKPKAWDIIIAAYFG